MTRPAGKVAQFQLQAEGCGGDVAALGVHGGHHRNHSLDALYVPLALLVLEHFVYDLDPLAVDPDLHQRAQRFGYYPGLDGLILARIEGLFQHRECVAVDRILFFAQLREVH